MHSWPHTKTLWEYHRRLLVDQLVSYRIIVPVPDSNTGQTQWGKGVKVDKLSVMNRQKHYQTVHNLSTNDKKQPHPLPRSTQQCISQQASMAEVTITPLNTWPVFAVFYTPTRIVFTCRMLNVNVNEEGELMELKRERQKWGVLTVKRDKSMRKIEKRMVESTFVLTMFLLCVSPI